MGGSYLASIRSMRGQGASRPDIEEYFMELDAELERRRQVREAQERRLAALLHEVMSHVSQSILIKFNLNKTFV